MVVFEEPLREEPPVVERFYYFWFRIDVDM